MTWFKYRNFGTALQAVALPYVLEKAGYNVELINYRTRPIGRVLSRRYPLFKKACSKLKSLYYGSRINQEREKKFDMFLQRVSFSAPANTYSELRKLSGQYDAIICGSDQIWSPLNFDDKFYLSFVHEKSKKIAYAPSFGVSQIEDPDIEAKIKTLIEGFEYLSVREQQGAELISKLCGKHPLVVLDPTLLLSKDEWDDVADVGKTTSLIQQKLPEKYAISYFLGNGTKYCKYLKAFSKRTGMPIYSVPMQNRYGVDNKNIFEIPFEVGPAEFVALIKGAEHVITDSFHAFSFGVLYDRKVTVFERFKKGDSQNQNSRIHNLANLLSLSDRVVEYDNVKTIESQLEIDYSHVALKLSQLKNQSLNYLLSSVAEASNTSRSKICSVLDIIETPTIGSMCCGCEACKNICPVKAISIKINNIGFYNCSVDDNTCVNCGKCLRVCPFYQIEGRSIIDSKGFYSACTLSSEQLKKSSSGAIAWEMGKYGIENGWTIGGSEYNLKEENAKHIGLYSMPELARIQGSKYLQSDFSRIYELIHAEQKSIIFGLPCQIGGLHNFLVEKGVRDKYILIDLICHGVPSYLLWEKYLLEIKRRFNISNDKKASVIFRDKKYGWHKKYISILIDNKRYLKRYDKDNFGVFFEMGNVSMPTCYECPYREKSLADIRIGDYWGDKYENNNKGVSMVSALTTIGYEFLQMVFNNKCTVKTQPMDDYYKVQAPYNQQIPIYYFDLIEDLKQGRALRTLRKRYCRKYEIQAKLSSLWQKFSTLLKK